MFLAVANVSRLFEARILAALPRAPGIPRELRFARSRPFRLAKGAVDHKGCLYVRRKGQCVVVVWHDAFDWENGRWA